MPLACAAAHRTLKCAVNFYPGLQSGNRTKPAYRSFSAGRRRARNFRGKITNRSCRKIFLCL